MAHLTVKLHGQEVFQISLEAGCEYIAGRGTDAQIPLAEERAISRHHLKFYQRDDVWVCESLSKFAMVHLNGQPHQVIELSDSCVFSVAPYEFYFEFAQASHASATPQTESQAEAPTSKQLVLQNTSSYNADATVAAVASNLIPYIRVSFPDSTDNEILKLEGHLWVGGRDPNCEIPLDSAHVSRKHFELARTQEGFFITDLGSSNGTKVNGQRIAPHEPTQVASGDEISVKSVKLVFEIRDSNFNNRISQFPTVAPEQMYPHAPDMQQPAWPGPTPEYGAPAYGSYDPTVLRSPEEMPLPPPGGLKDPETRKKFIRMALIVVVVLLIAAALKPADKPKEPGGTPGANNNSLTFEKMSSDQKSLVKDSFNLARNLYVQGKYELCLTELAKVHELIPAYENSKELESFCMQGKDLVTRQRDLDRKDRERQAIENQISGYIETCRTKITERSTVDEVRECLAQAIELNPDHPAIMELINNAQAHEEDRKFSAEQREAERRRAARGQAQYNKAKALYKDGRLARSLIEYETFLNTSYPRMDEVKSTAKREVASIKEELKKKVDSLLDNCNALAGQGKFKDAYAACDKAVAEDGDNTTAKDLRKKMVNELRREMKSIYEDSVLEESLGNVDSAKEKWRKIVADDLEKGEYALKAKSKLQKYGLGN
jgi:pSer/pThr/pTyr-binding forkhead associated (FHA) protein/tetratricopeptide (TPR) repeat protein